MACLECGRLTKLFELEVLAQAKRRKAGPNTKIESIRRRFLEHYTIHKKSSYLGRQRRG